MRAVRFGAVALSIVTIAGCGGSGRDAVSDELRRDLEASAASLELANPSAGQPMRFVSELEQGKEAEPVERTRTPRRVAARTAGVQQNETTSPMPEAQQELQVAVAPSESQAPQPVPDAPSVPSVAPRPASLPVDVPAEAGRGEGSWGTGRGQDGSGIGIGDVIGVVIRGGGVGPDHCPPRGRRPRGPIGIRLP